jgi:predicted DNA-binding transcriptional regulator AlpA
MPRFYRLKQIIGDRKNGIEPIIPVSRASWYAGIKSGKYPAPVRLSERTVAWRESDIIALCEKLEGGY